MNKTLKGVLLWTPRIAGILFILFLGMFALDVFDSRLGFWGTVLALSIHLIPSILLAVGIVLAWRREWVGAVIFIGWAVLYPAIAPRMDWIAYALISFLPALIGLLFLAGWVWRRQVRDG